MHAAEQELLEEIQAAISTKQPISPFGCGTSNDFGNLTDPGTLPLQSKGLDDVIDFDPPNQVVTVGAGMTLQALQDRLRTHGQWLPLRPTISLQKHSVGGVIALAACGPERLVYGAPRDLLLGLRFISGKGKVISTGGRVVKNVAGYDMTRLITGSIGTLGFITQATLRVSMLPETCVVVWADGDLTACAATATAIITSNLIPTFVVATSTGNGNGRTMGNHTEWRLHIGFEGLAVAVRNQADRVGEMCDAAGFQNTDQHDYDVYSGNFERHLDGLDRHAFVVRADVPPVNVAGFIESLNGQLLRANLMLDLGCGRVLGGLDHVGDAEWAQMGLQADSFGGHALLEKATPEFKQRHDTFGLKRSDWPVMHRVKTALDPDRIFAPGRLPGNV